MSDRAAARRFAVAAEARHRGGDGVGAERLYREALAADPDHGEAWYGLGALAHARGFHAEAIALLGRALRALPRAGHVHLMLGLALLAAGEVEASRAALALASLLEPADWRAQAAHGRVLARLGRHGEARAALDRALAAAPPDGRPELWHARAVLALAGGDAASAADDFERVAASRAGDAAALGNWGAALQAAGRFEQADAVLTRALGLAPEGVEALSNRGLARLGLGLLDAALADLARAEMLAPAEPAVLRNRASVHVERDERERARALLERVCAIDPADRDARFNLGVIDLAEGRLDAGWRGWAARPGPAPGWDGGPVGSGALLLEAEQGFGDTLMFLRYVALAAARAGGPVLLRVPAALRALASTLPGVARVLAPEEGVPDGARARARLGDLPALFSPDLDAIPAPAPFRADPARAALYRGRLDALAPGRRRIGIAWRGSPTYRQDRRRSIPACRLAPLARLDGVALVPLDPAASLEGGLDVAREGDDFADTAALLAAVDGVVTADTATVHLAGSLDRPTILLDRIGGDWRWLRGREVSPWYPAVRIVRDATHDPDATWHRPVATVAALLAGGAWPP